MSLRIVTIALIVIGLMACKNDETEPPETLEAQVESADAASATTESASNDDGAPEVTPPKTLDVDRPTPESPPEISDDVLAALCEGADNVDTSGDFPSCKECPFAAQTRYNTNWQMYYAFKGSFSKKRADELFVSGPGCYDADGNHAAALVRLSDPPKVIGAIRSTQADTCKAFDWFGRNAVACISEYQQRGEIRKLVTFFEVLDDKLKDLRMLDIPFKDASCTFEGIYFRDLKEFEATTDGRGHSAKVDVRLSFDAKIGTRKKGTPGDCMAIPNGDVEVTSAPEVFTISITTDAGSTVTRQLGDEDPVELDVDSTGKPKDPTYDLNRPQ